MAYLTIKRMADVILSLTALILLLPVLLLIALIIVIDDHGAPIFWQKRCGKDGREFVLFKFRTMKADAEELEDDLLDQNEMDGPVFKIKNDPRITRVGGFLRSTGIDELPQLINILMGDMSIVGPRPALPMEVEQYSDSEKLRLSIQPGLTCYWQIQPNRNDLSFSEWVELDVKYIKERSLWVDFKIILMTVGAVLRHDGA